MPTTAAGCCCDGGTIPPGAADCPSSYVGPRTFTVVFGNAGWAVGSITGAGTTPCVDATCGEYVTWEADGSIGPGKESLVYQDNILAGEGCCDPSYHITTLAPDTYTVSASFSISSTGVVTRTANVVTTDAPSHSAGNVACYFERCADYFPAGYDPPCGDPGFSGKYSWLRLSYNIRIDSEPVDVYGWDGTDCTVIGTITVNWFYGQSGYYYRPIASTPTSGYDIAGTYTLWASSCALPLTTINADNVAGLYGLAVIPDVPPFTCQTACAPIFEGTACAGGVIPTWSWSGCGDVASKRGFTMPATVTIS